MAETASRSEAVAISPRAAQAIPRGVWALGCVSLCMDVSTEMTHALLPVFMVTVLGASPLAVGLIEGIAEAVASVTKGAAGVLSDRVGRRKIFVLWGYGLSALTKPLFPLAASIDWIFAARAIDRIGKGLRLAPRDAMVSGLAPPHLRGASFGLRQTLDNVGAVLGPLLAVAIMFMTADSFRAVFTIAIVPAIVAVVVLVFAVREVPPVQAPAGPSAKPRLADLGGLGAAFWAVVALAALMTVARTTKAFLVLRADSAWLGATLVPLVMVTMNAVYAVSAYPFGRLADRADRRILVAAGFALLVATDLVLAAADGPALVLAGVALWALHMGLTQGLVA
ncbi:MAG: MFS transporter, partial [Proteobacteria bacterium]|nr:MFS transporter [Pseudomonadota bacterium]